MDHVRNSSSLVTWTAVAVLMIVLTVFHTWPLSRVATTHLIASADVTSGSWSLTGLATQLTADPLHPFDGHNLYPADRTLAVLDHQLAHALMVAPVLALGGSDALAFNLSMLLGFILSGLFTCVLVRSLTGSLPAGIVAGCAFAFSGFRIQQLTHPHIIATEWIPLALLALHRFVRRPDARSAFWFSSSVVLVALSSMQVAFLGAIGIGVVAVFGMAATRGDRVVRSAGIAAAALVGAIALLPLALTYAEVAGRWGGGAAGGYETQGTLAMHSVDLARIVSLPGISTAPYAGVVPRDAGEGASLFQGLMALLLIPPALGGLGLVLQRFSLAIRFRTVAVLSALGLLAVLVIVAAAAGGPGELIVRLLRPVSPVFWLSVALLAVLLALAYRSGAEDARTGYIVAYLGLATVGLLMALGPRVLVAGVDVGSGIARYDLLPIPLTMRAPARFALLSAMGISVLAGFGVERVLRGVRSRPRLLLTLLIVVLMNVELAFAVPQLIAVPGLSPAQRWLAGSEEPGAIIEYPIAGNYWAVSASYQHGRRLVNGAGYLMPPVLRALEAAPDFSMPQFEMLWRSLRPRFVVVRVGEYPASSRGAIRATLQEREAFLKTRFQDGNEFVYELVDRGRGPVLYREWQKDSLLSSAGELVLSSRVTSGRVDTIATLTVLLNGETLLASTGPELEAWEDRSVRFEAAHLVDGVNIFEISADYRFESLTERYPIGTTGVDVPADLAVHSEAGRSLIEINGRHVVGRRGYLVVALDRETGMVASHGSFDTHGDPTAAARLVQFIGAIAAGSPVVVATRYDAATQLSREAALALRQLGLEGDLTDRTGWAHAAIGVKGARAGSALENISDGSAKVGLGAPYRRRVQLRGLDLR